MPMPTPTGEVRTDIIATRVACPKFGRPALSSELYKYALNQSLYTSAAMLREKKIIIQQLKQLKN